MGIRSAELCDQERTSASVVAEWIMDERDAESRRRALLIAPGLFPEIPTLVSVSPKPVPSFGCWAFSLCLVSSSRTTWKSFIQSRRLLSTSVQACFSDVIDMPPCHAALRWDIRTFKLTFAFFGVLSSTLAAVPSRNVRHGADQ